jgi:hypothetical protein
MSKMAAQRLHFEKEHMKAHKFLREVMKLKTLPKLNANELAKVNKEGEVLQWIQRLEMEFGVQNPDIRNEVCTHAPLVDHQQAEVEASHNKAREPQESAQKKVKRRTGKKVTQIAGEQTQGQELSSEHVTDTGESHASCNIQAPKAELVAGAGRPAERYD